MATTSNSKGVFELAVGSAATKNLESLLREAGFFLIFAPKISTL